MTVDTAFINSQIDIRSVAEKAGAVFHHNSSRCPVHGGDNPTAFSIFNNGQSWNCFTHEAECNKHGHDGIALLMALNGWSFKEVCERYNQPVDQEAILERAIQNAKRAEAELQEKIHKAQSAMEELRKAQSWIRYHDNLSEETRELWRTRGIPDSWQDYWKLGYSPTCPTYHQSPSLTIPIFNPEEKEPLNIRHRVLQPENPADKYRPEKAGLPAVPFYADLDLPLERAERIIVVEGEIKAAVTFLTLDQVLWQVVGIPGKHIFEKLIPSLKDHKETVIILDPDAKEQAVKMARSIGGAKVVDLPEKIDDIILKYNLDSKWILSLCHNARLVA